MASAAYRSLRAPIASVAWKMVMHQGLPVDQAAERLKTTPRRVEYLLLAFARRRAGRLVA